MRRQRWGLGVFVLCLLNPSIAEAEGPHIRWYFNLARQVDPESKHVRFEVIPESRPEGQALNAYYHHGSPPRILFSEAMLKVLYPNSGELLAIVTHELGHHLLTTQPGLFESFHVYFHRHLYYFAMHEGIAKWEPEVAADILALCMLFAVGNPWDLFAIHGKFIGHQGPKLFGWVLTDYTKSHPFPEKRIDFIRRAWQDFQPRCRGLVGESFQIRWKELFD